MVEVVSLGALVSVLALIGNVIVYFLRNDSALSERIANCESRTDQLENFLSSRLEFHPRGRRK